METKPAKWAASPEFEDLPPTLTVDQAAVVAQASDHTIRRRVDDGTLKAYRVGPKAIRIDRESLVAMMRSTVVGA